MREPLFTSSDSTEENEDQTTVILNGHFIEYQRLIDVIFRMRSLPIIDIDKFRSFCSIDEDDGNTLVYVDKYLKSRSAKDALRLYTDKVYRVLNKALRKQESDVIVHLGWLIRDIYKAVKCNQCRTAVEVYRGQWILKNELNNLQQMARKFICTTSFFSTSTDPLVARLFLSDHHGPDNYQRVLFKIKADPCTSTNKPFADISRYSTFPIESEILFLPGSIFYIEKITNISDDIWEIEMTLCDNETIDEKHIFKDTKMNIPPDLRTLADVLKNMGQPILAKQIYLERLSKLTPKHTSYPYICVSLSSIAEYIGDNDGFISWAKTARDAFEQCGASDDVAKAKLWNMKGEINRREGNLNEALKMYFKAFAFFRKANLLDHPNVALVCQNISLAYQQQTRFNEALIFEERKRAICKSLSPDYDKDIAKSYDMTGLIYRSIGGYDLALTYFEESLKIKRTLYSSYHIQIGDTYRYMGSIYEYKTDFLTARSYFQKALSIYKRIFPLTHRDIITTDNDIERLQLILQNNS